MPNPRDRLKFTGDTRLPDVGEEDEMIVEEVLVVEAVVPVQEEPGAASRMQPPSAQHHWLDAAREQVRAKPVAALTGAFVLGLLLARI